ncbi:MAG: hypothetical protein ACI39U_06130 [Candidatus Cryptobacteroides sp.]
MNRTDRLIFFAIVMVVLAQLVVCNYLFFGPMVTLTLLPVAVLFIPLRQKTPLVMVEAFLIGLFVDWLSDGVPGLNAAALVPVAFVRDFLVRLFVGEDTVVRRDPVTVGKSGWFRMIAMISVATLLFLLVYVPLDSAGTRSFGFNAARTGLSFAASLVVGIVLANVFSNLNKREQL